MFDVLPKGMSKKGNGTVELETSVTELKSAREVAAALETSAKEPKPAREAAAVLEIIVTEPTSVGFLLSQYVPVRLNRIYPIAESYKVYTHYILAQ